MNAKDARELKVGDWVIACFGTRYKQCQIIGIAWPYFDLRAKDYKGESMERRRTYRSLGGKCSPKPAAPNKLPIWLRYDSQQLTKEITS